MKSRQRLNLLHLSVSKSFYFCQFYIVLELHRNLMLCLRESEQDLMESPQSGKSCAKLILEPSEGMGRLSFVFSYLLICVDDELFQIVDEVAESGLDMLRAAPNHI